MPLASIDNGPRLQCSLRFHGCFLLASYVFPPLRTPLFGTVSSLPPERCQFSCLGNTIATLGRIAFEIGVHGFRPRYRRFLRKQCSYTRGFADSTLDAERPLPLGALLCNADQRGCPGPFAVSISLFAGVQEHTLQGTP